MLLSRWVEMEVRRYKGNCVSLPKAVSVAKGDL